MIPYILHASCITAVCFLFYKLFLQKATFYRLNRWILVTCLAVSFLLPLVSVPRQWSWSSGYEKLAARFFKSEAPVKQPEAKISRVENRLNPEQKVAETGPAITEPSMLVAAKSVVTGKKPATQKQGQAAPQ